ncbi:unnamed protein product [Fraxinus pennsylvanica]|uniref:Uncharacterized protein n=1 Tax=Fraxinus pennsylvanica TaxID=56036 RepID=A0AAD2DS61_9LAMI|nr:unnamed protein product [Fraxinus pennsylvanica]
MMRSQSRHQQDHQSKIFYELSALVLNIIRSPPTPIDFSDEIQPRRRPPSRIEPAMQQITPAGFASLLLGISLSLMLCGSLTFFIGFMLMPWVLGLPGSCCETILVVRFYAEGFSSTHILWPWCYILLCGRYIIVDISYTSLWTSHLWFHIMSSIEEAD